MTATPANTTSPSTATQDPKPTPAWRSVYALSLFVIITAFAVGSDLWSKDVAFETLLDKPDLATRTKEQAVYLERCRPNFPDLPAANTEAYSRLVLQQMHLTKPLGGPVDLTLSVNPGVVFGFDEIPDLAVNLVTVLMCGVLIGLFVKTHKGDWWMHIALGFILGGAIGNLYDRLASHVPLPGLLPIQHHVRDFIDCSRVGYQWIFNLADVYLVIGVAGLMIHWVVLHRRDLRAAKAREARDA